LRLTLPLTADNNQTAFHAVDLPTRFIRRHLCTTHAPARQLVVSSVTVEPSDS